MTISRLWRKLGAHGPLFTITADSWGTIEDPTLAGYVVTHGSNGDATGLIGSTAEIRTAGNLAFVNTASDVSIGLSDYGASVIAGIIGADPAGTTPARKRFFGRVAGVEVDDRGDRDRDSWSTSVGCSSYAALAKTLSATFHNTAFWPIVTTLYLAALKYELGGAATLALKGAGWPATRYVDGDELNTSDVLGTWLDGLGVLLRTARGARVAFEAWTLAQRAAAGLALAQNTTAPALLRRQCVAPVTWSIPFAVPSSITYSISRDDGGIETGGAIPFTGQPTAWNTTDINLTDLVRSTTDQAAIWPQSAAQADVFRSCPIRYSVNTIRVDLLHLLTTGDAVDKATAGMLLRLDAGDPVKLGYDWPDEISGIVYASRIREEVTPDSWTLDIDTHTSEQVTGSLTGTPPVPGATWDTAYPQSKAWDDAPTSTTWETAP